MGHTDFRAVPERQGSSPAKLRRRCASWHLPERLQNSAVLDSTSEQALGSHLTIHLTGGEQSSGPGPGSWDWEGLKGRGVCGHKTSETSGRSDRVPREEKNCSPCFGVPLMHLRYCPWPKGSRQTDLPPPLGRPGVSLGPGPLLGRSLPPGGALILAFHSLLP